MSKTKQKMFKKDVTGMQQIFKKDNEVTLLKWSFKRCNYQRLTQKELEQLSDTAFFFFRFLDEFGKYKGIEDILLVYTVDKFLQSFDLFNSISIWIYLNLWKPVWWLSPSQKNCIENSWVNYLLFSLNSRHKKMLDAVILEHYVEFAESDTPIE